MNGDIGTVYEDDLLESWDSDDDELLSQAEFLPAILGPIAGALAPAVGNLVGGLFGGGQQQRPPLPPVRVPGGPGGGVQAGQITTPAGSASFRLPEPVATKRDLDQTTQTLQAAINTERTRLNTTQKDLETLTQRVAVVVSDTAKDVQKLRVDLARSRRAQTAAMARSRREQASAQQTSMMMTMFLQRQIQDDLESHTHSLSHTHAVPAAGAGEVSGDSSVNSTAALESSDDNSLLFLLPMMFAQPQGGGGGEQQGMDMSSMMMMMLALK